MVEWVTANWADVLELVLAVLGAASIVAKLTPTEVDNKALAALTNVIHTFGLTKKP